MKTKICKTCKKPKSINEFAKNIKGKNGLGTKCKLCYNKHIREWNKQKGYKKSNLYRYGMTIADFNKMKKSQNGVCQICGKPETRICSTGEVQDLSVDHNHISGKVRGLLCNRCNCGIGIFYDDIALLIKAANYLTETVA